jgi:hypothetical protein
MAISTRLCWSSKAVARPKQCIANPSSCQGSRQPNTRSWSKAAQPTQSLLQLRDQSSSQGLSLGINTQDRPPSNRVFAPMMLLLLVQ